MANDTDNRLLAFFPEHVIDLNREILEHPVLQERLRNHPSNEFEVRLAEIASYCDVILDGVYTGEDYNKLCKILLDRLKQKRGGIVIVSGKVQ